VNHPGEGDLFWKRLGNEELDDVGGEGVVHKAFFGDDQVRQRWRGFPFQKGWRRKGHKNIVI